MNALQSPVTDQLPLVEPGQYIIGIDPGVKNTAYAVIRTGTDKPDYIASGCLRHETLVPVLDLMRELVMRYRPCLEIAIESCAW